MGGESVIVSDINITPENHVAKPNYQSEKRQRELEKKKKKEEKAQRKASMPDVTSSNTAPADAPEAGQAAQAPQTN